jgi:hypothetical protein
MYLNDNNGCRMNFLLINTTELTALLELPYIQRVVYLMGIRPYMDRETGIVGLKRRISYQSLSEVLYVGPIAGVKTSSPSLSQIKRAIKALERAGLIELQSTEQQLILKCILAESGHFVQKQAVPRPNQEAVSDIRYKNTLKSFDYEDFHSKADRGQIAQAVPPHINSNNYIFLYKQFEKFWSLYPAKKSHQRAWEVFQQLNPSETLMAEILIALKAQIDLIQYQQASGQWVPNWKNPANWLAQHCWKDELVTNLPQGTNHAKNKSNYKKQHATDPLWDLCKASCDEPEDCSDNVIQFPKCRN